MFIRFLLVVLLTNQAFCQNIIPVSLDRNGLPINTEWLYDLSENGQFIVFASDNNNIVPDDTNRINRGVGEQGPASDVFLLNRISNEVNRVSLQNDGGQIENGRSFFRSVNKDFRYILYMSEGNSQFPNDTAEYEGHPDPDLYLFDTITQQVRWLSVSPNGEEGNQATSMGVVSGSGRYAIFISGATNLLPEDAPYNSYAQLIRVDSSNDTRELVSVSLDGIQPYVFSGNAGSVRYAVDYDGRYVAFFSHAKNLVEEGVGGLFLRDMEMQTTELISKTPDGIPIPFEQFFEPDYLDISDDGRYIFFTSPSNQHVVNDPHPQEKIGDDGFIYDRVTKQTKIISLGRFESQNRESGIVRGSMSSNGRYVIGVTKIDNGATFPELFLYDQYTDTVELLISPEKNHPLIPSPNISGIPRITSDGKHVLFSNAVYDEGGRFLQSNILYLLTRDVSTSHIDAWDSLE